MKSKIGGATISKEEVEHLIITTVSASLVAAMLVFSVSEDVNAKGKLQSTYSSEELCGNKTVNNFILEGKHQELSVAMAEKSLSKEIKTLERKALNSNSLTDTIEEFIVASIEEKMVPLSADFTLIEQLETDKTTNNEIMESSDSNLTTVSISENAVVSEIAELPNAEKEEVEPVALDTESQDNEANSEEGVEEAAQKVESAEALHESKDEVTNAPVEEKKSKSKSSKGAIDSEQDREKTEAEQQEKTENSLSSDKEEAEVEEKASEIEIPQEPEVVIPQETEAIADAIAEAVVEIPGTELAPVAPVAINSEAVDNTYCGSPIDVGEQRDLLERLVMGEAGNQGFEGAALVAQTLHDNMLCKGTTDVAQLKKMMKYSGSTSKEPTEDVKLAVALIFDQGGYAVQHQLNYFYNPEVVKSGFHESQTFVTEYKNHRFFAMK